MPREVCCDPFDIHRRQVTKGLLNVTEDLLKKYEKKDGKLKKGLKICRNCCSTVKRKREDAEGEDDVFLEVPGEPEGKKPRSCQVPSSSTSSEDASPQRHQVIAKTALQPLGITPPKLCKDSLFKVKQ